MFWKDEPFEPVPLPVLFLRSPLKTIITLVHGLITDTRGSPKALTPSIKVVCISDTHSKTKDIPHGDILIHAGDLTNAGTVRDLQEQIDWLDSLPHKHKICIAGNHDSWLDPKARQHMPEKETSRKGPNWRGVIYLQHSSTTLKFATGRTLKVYGAPQIPACGGPDFAFQYPRGRDAWSGTIPEDTDILVTHTPLIFHRDLPTGRGCEFLLREAWKIKPILHICGHVHAGRGKEMLFWDKAQKAYEQASFRRDGFLLGVLDPILWIDLAKVVAYGISGFLWTNLWGGEQDSTRLVNAALTYRNTGQLKNEVQVVSM